jgi:Uma2 family endonuclease
MSSVARRTATLEDFLAIPEERRFHELIAGEIVEKASPSGEHGDAQGGILGAIRPPFQRPPGRGGPGGWWILPEVEVLLSSGDLVRPDIAGWRRDRQPERPTGTPIRTHHDWICEIVSPTNASNDTVRKVRLYHQARIPHYWLVDPRDATLTVLRWTEAGFTTVLASQRGETVRAEPFEGVELEVGTLFGDDPS